jgi:hypothetical protein
MNIPTETVLIGSVGVVLLAILSPTLLRAWRLRRWRPAAATVLESWLDDGGGDPRNRRAKFCIRYRYTVAGIVHKGERLAFTSPIYRNTVKAQRVQDTLPPGKRIEVWYNPADPADVVIDKRISRTRFYGAALGVLCVAEVLVMIVVVLLVG